MISGHDEWGWYMKSGLPRKNFKLNAACEELAQRFNVKILGRKADLGILA